MLKQFVKLLLPLGVALLFVQHTTPAAAADVKKSVVELDQSLRRSMAATHGKPAHARQKKERVQAASQPPRTGTSKKRSITNKKPDSPPTKGTTEPTAISPEASNDLVKTMMGPDKTKK